MQEDDSGSVSMAGWISLSLFASEGRPFPSDWADAVIFISSQLALFGYVFFVLFRVSNIKTEMLTEQDRHLACVCDNKTSYRVYSLFLLR